MKKALTATSIISSKYQTVIPKEIVKSLGLKINQELIWSVYQTQGGPVCIVTPKPKSWLDL